ncbi:class I SAM-dependent methyltransferase [Oricola thermophila]|uniref:Methyltransferase domain-containing protein n=1 Tax=Oricola thermophila TaxID=2742145 RepID=A0A6N1V8R0_9HYPH|nr:class I SAM-dependent methyltransferase [Oricola thermophila]QKV17366.1 methyltransferase domain-containing protein [Oricola thermophila]
MTINPTFAAPSAAHEQPSPLVDFWNDILAPKFIRYRHILVGGLSRHSAAVMPALGIAPGSSVLDVGCGFGDTAIEIAHRVAPGGHVVGIDCCQAFLDIAWNCAEFSLAPNIHFAARDAERGLEENAYDFVFSRFGTMFFMNPVAGLRSMRKALKPGGRVAHIVWRRREDNPWLNEPHQVVRRFLPPPGEEALTCGPGPFSMASEDVTRAQMEAAGFTDIAFRRIDAKVLVGRDIEDAIGFQLAIGPAGETFREAGELGQARRAGIVRALEELFSGVETTPEGLWMDSSSWLITARSPGS